MPPSQSLPAEYPRSVLAAQDLACERGGRIVFKGLSFSVDTGGALRLLGPNGSGKSSLLRTLAGLLAPAAGVITWNGDAIEEDRDAHKMRLIYAGHADAVKPWLTVAENLSFWAKLYGLKDQIGPAVTDALSAVALDHAADLPARLLSAGQRRRLSLARLAIVPLPLWLLDEPTAALDGDSIRRIETLIRHHRDRGGMAIVAIHGELDLPGATDLRIDAGRQESAKAAG